MFGTHTEHCEELHCFATGCFPSKELEKHSTVLLDQSQVDLF